MTLRESNPDRLSLRLCGEGAIREGIDAARQFGTARRLGEDGLARLCIVVEELLANLYDHGGLGEADAIELDMADDVRGIRLSILDPGVPFDPWSALPAEGGGARGGGAGLRLIREWAEPISYGSLAEGNRLELLVPVDRGG